jgi:hypothetical protein
LVRVLAIAAALTGWGVVLIIAGHGMGPIAYLLVRGSAEEWLAGQIFGWIGVTICVLAIFARTERSYAAWRAWGCVILFFSVLAFAGMGEGTLFALLTAVPFIAITILYLWRYFHLYLGST